MVLFVVQFLISIGMVICLIVINRQRELATKTNPGFAKDSIVAMPIVDCDDDSILIKVSEVLTKDSIYTKNLLKTFFPAEWHLTLVR